MFTKQNSRPKDCRRRLLKLEYEILEYRKNMVLAKNTIEDLNDEKVTAEQQIAQIIALIEKLKVELEKYDLETLAKIQRGREVTV